MSTETVNAIGSSVSGAPGHARAFPEGLLGKKLGMTQVFTEAGEVIPVTIVQVGPCHILDVRTNEQHGYSAVQFGFDPKKQQRIDKALMGHFAKAGKGGFYMVSEVRCDAQRLGWTTPGHEVKVADVFAAGELVDISGVTKGRGFAGVVKRFKVGGQPATRGTHEYRRHIGAIGNRKFPGRVKKNQRMPGHMGNEAATVKNLRVIGVNPEENILLVQGGIPGSKGGFVVVRKARKTYRSAKAA